MQMSFSRSVLWTLIVGLATTVGAGRAAAQSPVGTTTEGLIKATGLAHQKIKDGLFKVFIDSSSGQSVIIIEEKKAPWKDNSGKEVVYAYLWCQVIPLPAEFKPPTAMLTQLAEMNDRIRFGSLGIGKNPDGTGAVYRNATMFLKNSDAEELSDYIYISHNERLSAEKALRGYLVE